MATEGLAKQPPEARPAHSSANSPTHGEAEARHSLAPPSQQYEQGALDAGTFPEHSVELGLLP